MQPKIDKEKTPSIEASFSKELNTILSTPLTPDNIDTYADDALVKLVDLSGKVVRAFQKDQADDVPVTNALEDEAFQAYGLADINDILTFVAQKSEDIKALDTVIAQAETINDVITPPELLAAISIIAGSGTFERLSNIPRLKTLLFILEEDFGIDPQDSTQLVLTKGLLRDNMMRNESYYSIETPTLNRTTLVCDEEHNATFIFDNEKLQKQGISHGDLIRLSKNELRELIEEDPTAGQRIVFNNETYVSDVLRALRAELSNEPVETSVSYLVPSVPEGGMSARVLAEQLGIAARTVTLAIAEIKDELEPIRVMVRNNPASYYLEDDQQRIIRYLDEKHLLAPHAVPELHKSVLGMSDEFGVTRRAIDRAINSLKEQGRLNDVPIVKFRSYVGPGYLPEHQALIKDWLIANSPKRSKGGENDEPESRLLVINGETINLAEYATQLQLAAELGVDRYLIAKMQVQAKDELGEVLKIGGYIQYSPTQQDIIKQRVAEYLEQMPDVESDLPESYKSGKQLAREWDVHSVTFGRAVDALGESLGVVLRTQRSNNITSVYSPEQQQLLKDWLIQNAPKTKLAQLALSNR